VQNLTLLMELLHTKAMKNKILLIGIVFLLCGCGNEERTNLDFPKIDNPLDQEDLLKNTLKEATELSDLIVTLDGDLQMYKAFDNSPYSGWIKKSYDGGKLGYLFQCKSGIQDGLYTAWYENGKKMVERMWRTGKREGPFKTWSDSGFLQSRGYNKNNLRNDLFEEFYADGKKKSAVEYLDGKIETFFRWQPDGQKCPYTSVNDGNGIVVYYKEDGTIDSNESYYQGELDYGRPADSNDSGTDIEGIIDLNSSINVVPEKQ